MRSNFLMWLEFKWLGRTLNILEYVILAMDTCDFSDWNMSFEGNTTQEFDFILWKCNVPEA